jgi:sec-independent protein translocase protein TatC
MWAGMEQATIIAILQGARRFLAQSLLSVLICSIAAFPFSKNLILFLTRMIKVKLYYFSLPEVLFATIQLALYSGLFLSMPVVIFLLWRMLRKTLREEVSVFGFRLALSAVFLFYIGALFCFFVVLPSGISFLLSYGSEAVKATISVQRFVVFCGAMVFAFGLAFELPLTLLLLAKTKIVGLAGLRRTRRFAILFIAIAAAAITPTPDLFNMSLLGVPLYILYEFGIILVRLEERRRASG